ncbi:MAG TPA: MerR family transcriptional regulator [Nocardioides sp.]|uniref:MerR family transcriptional regulator n=1 Tax=Nocardioides sp. TaxID=35761 RepID=UPI002F41AA38
MDAHHAVYPISVASELSGVEPQMLRVYEQRGLVSPFRTGGGTRRYSKDDIARIADITSLLAEGLNLAGVGQVLKLRDQTHQLATELGELREASEPHREEIRQLRQENHDLRAELVQRNHPGRGPTQHRQTEPSQPDDGSRKA